ncbi:MAG: hypothetical protein JSW23_02050, partial [Planctomycetota bacterium]
QPMVNSADSRRRLAEDRLFVGDGTSLGEAAAVFVELADSEASQGYRDFERGVRETGNGTGHLTTGKCYMRRLGEGREGPEREIKY